MVLQKRMACYLKGYIIRMGQYQKKEDGGHKVLELRDLNFV